MSIIKKAICLNGPRSCGKDTAALALLEHYRERSEIFKFTVPVKEETHKRYGLHVPFDFFEDRSIKDSPSPLFNGLSPRQAYINVGRDMRREFGEDVVINMLRAKIRQSPAHIIINPDCGGDEEALGIGEEVGFENLIVMRIKKIDGPDYTGDSRTWVTNPKLNIVNVINVKDEILDYKNNVVSIFSLFADKIHDVSTKSRHNHSSPPQLHTLI